MFMDPTYVIEAPPDGWPNITSETMQGLGKTDEVIDLLRHLPYIDNKPNSNLPKGLPGGSFINWQCVAEGLSDGTLFPENELLMSEGLEEQFWGKIPARCIGLVYGGLLMGEDPDVILLDTRSGVVHWMNCPAKIKETASPQPSYPFHVADGDNDDSDDDKYQAKYEDDNEETKDKYKEAQDKDDNNNDGDDADDDADDNEDEEDEDEDDDDDDDGEIQWGPHWPVRQFFEMLKNQFRQLNFMAKDAYDVFDIWTEKTGYGTPIPEGFTDTLQAIYRSHGWPDVDQYQKDQCLSAIKKELDENYPGHYDYFFR